MKYIESECARCGDTGIVYLSEIITAAKKNGKEPSGLPYNWKSRDLGIIGEEIFDLCDKCSSEYAILEERYFREFIRSMVVRNKK